MQYIFSPDFKFSTWRRLWIALAESEKELGLNITQEQIDEMRAHVDDIDYELAAQYEHKLRHDVMAHVHTYGDACPKAKPIIHLGATSCYVGDNTDIIQMKEGFIQVKKLLVNAINALARFARENKDVPNPSIYPLPGGSAHYHGKTGYPVAAGSGDGSGQTGI